MVYPIPPSHFFVQTLKSQNSVVGFEEFSPEHKRRSLCHLVHRPRLTYGVRIIDVASPPRLVALFLEHRCAMRHGTPLARFLKPRVLSRCLNLFVLVFLLNLDWTENCSCWFSVSNNKPNEALLHPLHWVPQVHNCKRWGCKWMREVRQVLPRSLPWGMGWQVEWAEGDWNIPWPSLIHTRISLFHFKFETKKGRVDDHEIYNSCLSLIVFPWMIN
jgi:hypothetical protein